MISVAAFATITLIVVLWTVDPSEAVWMPKCILKAITGYDCPSCGATRAAHALLHGEISQALHYNYFLVAGILYLSALFIACRIPLLKNSRFRRIVFGTTAAAIYIALFFGWWIIRNIPSVKELL